MQFGDQFRNLGPAKRSPIEGRHDLQVLEQVGQERAAADGPRRGGQLRGFDRIRLHVAPQIGVCRNKVILAHLVLCIRGNGGGKKAGSFHYSSIV